MSKLSQVIKAIGVLVVVVGLGILVGWLGTRGTKAPSAPPEPPQKVTGTTHVVPPPMPVPGSGETLNPPIPGEGVVVQPLTNITAVVPPTPRPQENLITNWDDRLTDILGAKDEDEASKARQLLQMFPHLPEEGQVEVAQHLANLTDDKDFPVLGAYLTNSATSEEVADVLMADLLNRPNNIKLPILLDVARSGPNPEAASEAKEILALFLDEDYGTDWQTWQTKLHEWLAENPD
jgi:hypothetical protein